MKGYEIAEIKFWRFLFLMIENDRRIGKKWR